MFMIANTAAWMGLENFLTVRAWLACYMAGSITMMSFWCCLYLLWVHVLHQPYPMPLIGVFNAIAGVFIIIVVIWFQFPVTWRQDQAFLYRAKYLLLAQFFILLMCVEYWFFSWVFYAIPLYLQWINSIILLVAREIGAHILNKICHKVLGQEDQSSEVIAAHLGRPIFQL